MKKKRKYLSNEEANYLGLELRKIQKGKQKARYMLDNEQWQTIINLRKNYVENTPLSVYGTSTLEDAEGNIKLQWIKRNKTEEDRLKALRIAIDTLKEDIKPTKPVKYKSNLVNNKLCNQYTLTDYHLGKLVMIGI
jgi:hypothetical protein